MPAERSATRCHDDAVLLRVLTSERALAAYAALPVAAVVAFPALRRRQLARAVRVASAVLLAAALLVMLSRTLGGATVAERHVNLVPGASISALLDDDRSDAVRNVVGNIVLFAPLGFFGVLALRRSVGVVTAAGCGLSIAVELTQLILGDRWVDVDDVLLNSLGTLLGAAVAQGVVAVVDRNETDPRQAQR
jgi:glycopeptide antibiotics resistance protein